MFSAGGAKRSSHVLPSINWRNQGSVNLPESGVSFAKSHYEMALVARERWPSSCKRHRLSGQRAAAFRGSIDITKLRQHSSDQRMIFADFRYAW